MTQPDSRTHADTRPSPFFDSLIVFLGPPALGFEKAWAAFQQAADRSVAAAKADVWWAAEEQLFAAICEQKDGKPPAADEILSIALGRPARATPTLHLMHHRGQWVPAIAIPLQGVRDGAGQVVSPRELAGCGRQIAAALGLVLTRQWAEWMAPVGEERDVAVVSDAEA